MKTSPMIYLSVVARVLIDIGCVYIITRFPEGYTLVICSVLLVVGGLFYEQITNDKRFVVTTQRYLICCSAISLIINRGVVDYRDIGDFVHTIDEYPQNVMFIKKSLLDSIVEFLILAGFISITPMRFYKYLWIIFIVLLALFGAILWLRNLEKTTFPKMNRSLSRFDKAILNITSHLEDVIGINAIDWIVGLINRIGRTAEHDKNNYQIITNMQQKILANSYILPVLLVFFFSIRSDTKNQMFSQMLIYLVLISNQILLTSSCVINAIVSGRYYKEIKGKLVRSKIEAPKIIKKNGKCTH